MHTLRALRLRRDSARTAPTGRHLSPVRTQLGKAFSCAAAVATLLHALPALALALTAAAAVPSQGAQETQAVSQPPCAGVWPAWAAAQGSAAAVAVVQTDLQVLTTPAALLRIQCLTAAVVEAA